MQNKEAELVSYLEKKFKKPIRNFLDRDWWDISNNIKLTEKFIYTWRQKVLWEYIVQSQQLSEKFIKDNTFWCNNYTIILKYQKLSGGFIRSILNFNSTYESCLSTENRKTYLKYMLKKKKITNEEFLQEILKISI